MYTCTNTSYLALLLEKSMRILYKFSMLCFFLLFLRKKYVLNFFLFLQCLDPNYYHYYNNKFRTSTRTHSCWVFFFFYNQIIGDNMSIISINCILIYWMEMYKKARTNTLNILEFDSNCVQNKTKQNKKTLKYNH